MTAGSVAGAPVPAKADSRIVIAPNCSLNGREALGFFVAIAGVSLLIALAFAIQGYWPVLPFAGAELALLGWAFARGHRRGRYREVITIDEGCVTLEKGYGPGEWRHEFNRHWVRPRLETRAWRDCHVMLASHGKQIEVGECLTVEERRALYKHLVRALRGT